MCHADDRNPAPASHHDGSTQQQPTALRRATPLAAAVISALATYLTARREQDSHADALHAMRGDDYATRPVEVTVCEQSQRI